VEAGGGGGGGVGAGSAGGDGGALGTASSTRLDAGTAFASPAEGVEPAGGGGGPGTSAGPDIEGWGLRSLQEGSGPVSVGVSMAMLVVWK